MEKKSRFRSPFSLIKNTVSMTVILALMAVVVTLFIMPWVNGGQIGFIQPGAGILHKCALSFRLMAFVYALVMFVLSLLPSQRKDNLALKIVHCVIMVIVAWAVPVGLAGLDMFA